MQNKISARLIKMHAKCAVFLARKRKHRKRPRLRDRVTPGQPIALQRNAFGDVVAEYQAGVTGEVAVVARDAVCEPGSRVVQILYSQGISG